MGVLRKLIKALGTIKSMDVGMPVRRGEPEEKVRLRTVENRMKQ